MDEVEVEVSRRHGVEVQASTPDFMSVIHVEHSYDMIKRDFVHSKAGRSCISVVTGLQLYQITPEDFC